MSEIVKLSKNTYLNMDNVAVILRDAWQEDDSTCISIYGITGEQIICLTDDYEIESLRRYLEHTANCPFDR